MRRSRCRKNTPSTSDLVTKDINLRLKARALNLIAEDYETGKVQNVQNLYRGNDLVDDVSHSSSTSCTIRASFRAEGVLPELPTR